MNIDKYREDLSAWIKGILSKSESNGNSFSLRDIVEDEIPDDSQALFADGFDEAIIGYSMIRWEEGSGDYRVVYDSEKMIECLVSRDGMAYEEAVEYLEFNTWGAYMGVNTPIYMSTVYRI